MDSEQKQNEEYLNTHPTAPLQPVVGEPDNGSPSSKVEKKDGGKSDKTGIRIQDLEDAKTPFDELAAKARKMEPASYTITDFTDYNKFLRISRHLKTVNDIFSKPKIPFRVPEIGKRFVRYQECLSADGRFSNFGTNYSYTGNDGVAGGATGTTPLSYFTPDANVAFVDDNRTLEMAWSHIISTMLITGITKNRFDWLTNGTRQNRAAASVTVTDLTALFTLAVDLYAGSVDTWSVGHWLLQPNISATEATAYGSIHIINANDYATFLNTNLNCALPAKTPVYDLTNSTSPNAVYGDNVLGKLILLDPLNQVVINNGMPVVNNSTYNGIPCRDVAAVAVSTRDNNIGNILDQSLDDQCMQMSLWMSLPYFTGDNALTLNSNIWKVRLHRANYQDMIIRYAARPTTTLGVTNTTPYHPLHQVIWSYRIAKTVLIQLKLKSYSLVAGMAVNNTSGRTPVNSDLKRETLCNWECRPLNLTDTRGKAFPVFIAYEFIKKNGCSPIPWDLDALTTTSGLCVTYNKYKWPQSLADDTADQSLGPIYEDYYIPNDTAVLANRAFNNMFTRARPLTFKCWKSDNSVMSIPPTKFNHDNKFIVDGYELYTGSYYNKETEDVSF